MKTKKNMWKRSFTAICLLSLMIAASGCQHHKKRVLKLAHGHDPSHPVHKGMVYMAERLQKISGGEMEIEIYTGGQLCAERECVELLQIGSLAMTKVSSAVMENFVPKYKILGLPYLFKDREHRFDVLDGEVGKEILLASTPFWLRGLTFYDAGSRSFYTIDRPINQPDDLKGMKIRVMKSVSSMNLIRNLGGSPTPIPYGELYTALQQGVVDGAENNPPSFYFSRHYEVCKYYTIDEHSSFPDVLLISTHIWEKLNEQEQQWLEQAVQESAVKQRELWAASEKECLEAVKKAGVEVIYTDKVPFVDKVQPMYENYKQDTSIYKLIQKITEKKS
ncbi:TRAP transporter substrate-binding protein [Rapidithrix thailandica]|uniref:TRAP transporter substrate-binding protein n=1 Tax=Rapidithrix thailandica TaxID=413964 RepID=A0AAW9SCV5_9BACT